MAMPAAEDRATTVTKVVSATYGSTELHAFQRAIPASDQVAVVAPVGGGEPRDDLGIEVRRLPRGDAGEEIVAGDRARCPSLLLLQRRGHGELAARGLEILV